ncbi:unnamed protein product [Phytophthora fragariaefolia]|uniref:Unnamed protein product n=1 Tax=Phytophthora fragariaefolia TaxID=1490495 RepID=A0A9W7CFV1_9STRA|nr:unnamed protein product [Phytophthora fragariaefolia]
MNAELAIRAACGVVLASFIQLRDERYDPTNATTKKWRFFPDSYYLGGLSYCPVMVVFSMGVNLGGTLREVCRGISGVGLAFIYNYALFMFIPIHVFDSNAENPYEDYYKIEKGFNLEAYWVNLPNLLRTLPWMILFTIMVLLLPFNVNTRKFALVLTIINPANPLDPTQLKSNGDEFFGTTNILQNLQIYSIVGVAGGLVSVLTMLIPYPIMYVIVKLEKVSMSNRLIFLIIDSYCFKSYDTNKMDMLKLKIERKFNGIEARRRQMIALLDDTWWEHYFGVHLIIPFNRAIMERYIDLVGSLIGDLHTLYGATRLKQNERLHSIYMKSLRREISGIQTCSIELLGEISLKVHAFSPSNLLSRNIQATVKLQQKAFNALFGYHLSSCVGMQANSLAEVRRILEVQLPRKHLKRKYLLGDAEVEPVLWRVPFLRHKHERALDISHGILNNIYLLFKLVWWFDSRVEQNRVTLSSLDIRDDNGGSRTEETASIHTKWHVATNHFLSLVNDQFNKIYKLYGNPFWHSNPEHTVVFMQLKAAFRLADKNYTGELGTDNVADMLEKMFGKSNKSTISFQEFAEAVENGLKLEVEVQHRRKSRTSPNGPDAANIQLSSFKRSGEADLQSVRDKKFYNTGRCRQPFVTDGDTIDIIVDKNAATMKPASHIDGSITRKIVDRRGSIIIEEVSLTITPNLHHQTALCESNDEDDTDHSALLSDNTSAHLQHDHDARNTEDFSIRDIAERMKLAYVEWLVSDNRFEQVSMDEQFLLQCLVNSAEDIAGNLAELHLCPPNVK